MFPGTKLCSGAMLGLGDTKTPDHLLLLLLGGVARVQGLVQEEQLQEPRPVLHHRLLSLSLPRHGRNLEISKHVSLYENMWACFCSNLCCFSFMSSFSSMNCKHSVVLNSKEESYTHNQRLKTIFDWLVVIIEISTDWPLPPLILIWPTYFYQEGLFSFIGNTRHHNY